MTAYNVVRFKVKPGNEDAFIEAHRQMRPTLRGFVSGSLIRTGDQTFCMVGEWRNFDSIVKARPQMISMLDQVRSMLEDFGGDLGVTDPVSGESIVRFGPPKKAAKKPAKRGGVKKATAKRRAGKAAGKRGAKKSATRKRKR
jgi:antibiotic biosynthesis monooxygenase